MDPLPQLLTRKEAAPINLTDYWQASFTGLGTKGSTLRVQRLGFSEGLHSHMLQELQVTSANTRGLAMLQALKDSRRGVSLDS